MFKTFFKKENFTNYKIFFILFLLLTFFFLGIPGNNISYKIFFAIKIFILFLLFKKNFTIKKNFFLLFINILLLLYLLINYLFGFSLDLKLYIYLLLFLSLIFLNFFEIKIKVSFAFFKYKNFLLFFFFIIFFFSLKISHVSIDDSDILKYQLTRHLYNYLFIGDLQTILIKRFGNFDLDVNYSALMYLIILQVLTKFFNKKNLIFFIFGLLILVTTKSKAGFFYFCSYYFIEYYQFFFKNAKNQIFVFLIILNLLIALLSLFLVNVAPSPFFGDPISEKKKEIFYKWRYNNQKFFQDIKFCVENKSDLDDENHPYHKDYKEILDDRDKYNQTLIKILNPKRPYDVGYSEDISSYYKDEKYFCEGKFYQYNLFQFFNNSNYQRFYTYGLSVKEMMSNLKILFFVNPYEIIKSEQKYADRDLRQNFTPHNFFLDLLMRFGGVVLVIFIVNLYFLTQKIQKLNSLYPFLFSSSFLAFETLIFLPLLILLIFIKVQNDF